MPFLLLMPSYNQAHYIGHAVDSILAQDDPDWELWIVDNSSDDTPRVMQRYAGEPRIRFHHIPERMDPGLCLNWMLEKSAGRGAMFSYVHTDNNLDPGYVRAMRAALAADDLALAYCDMRTINAAGRRIAVTRRGSFDFERLLSLSPLGVPFSATVALAHRLGGFSTDDVADDVRFCIEAWAHARFVHLPQPLIEYRVHGGSRTEATGGETRMQRAFLSTIVHVRPTLEQAGLQPVSVLAAAVARRLDDLDLAIEDWSYARRVDHESWWNGLPRLDPLFQAGLMPVPRRWRGTLDGIAPPRRQGLRSVTARGGPSLAAAWATRRLRRPLNSALTSLLNVLTPWAYVLLASSGPAEVRALRVCSADARTLIGAGMLRAVLGCGLLADPRVPMPGWLSLPTARGDEPGLDLSMSPSLTLPVERTP
jgi:hypothetical protein